MAVTDRVKQILSWYSSENPGTLTNLARLLNHGALAGTGKLVILPVDQGFEHGPVRSFAPNPAAYDPDYLYELAIGRGLATPTPRRSGSLEQPAAKFSRPGAPDPQGQQQQRHPRQGRALLGDHRLRGGRAPPRLRRGRLHDPTLASGQRNTIYQDLREITIEAKRKGLAVVVWSYPRGTGLSKAGETGIDICCYAATIAAQLGAHIVKVKPPTAHIEQEEAKKVYEKFQIPIGTLAERVKNVVQATFNGKRIVIFSGGEAKGTDAVLAEVKELAAGGSFGSIMGRNAFQRPRADALKLLGDVMDIYKRAG